MSLKARASVAAVFFGLAGCGYDGPDEKMTDAFAQRLLQDTKNDQSLVGTYNVMVHPDQGQLGVLIVENVEDMDETNTTCIDYRSFTSNTPNYPAAESQTRRACVPK